MKNNTSILTFILLISYFFILQNNFSQTTQKKDTLYFDADWKPTTKKNHEFYRPLPLKTIDSLSLIVDYYKNGNMQMQGYAYTHDLNIFAGDVYWYYNNGFDEKHEPYLNSTNKPLKYYHNNKNIWKTITYKEGVRHGEIKIFNEKGNTIISETYKNGLTLNDTVGYCSQRYYSARNNKAKKFNKNIPAIKNFTKILYWENTQNIAKVINYGNKTSRNFKIIEDCTYSKKGELIQHYYENDFYNNKLLNGEYYTIKTKNGFAVAFDTIRTSNQISKTLKVDNISYIGIHENHDEMVFLSKKGLDTYSKLDYELLYHIDTPKKSFRITDEQTGFKFTLEKLNDRFDKLVKVNDIKIQSVKELFKNIENKTWEINSSDGNNKKKLVFKPFNNEIFIFSELEFKKRYSGGFGSSLQQDDDAIKKWRLNEVEFYEINIILINGNKPILSLNQHRSGMEYYIIPTINNDFIVKLNDNKNTVEKRTSNFNETVLKEIINYSNASSFYGVKTKNQKKYLTNNFDEILIDKPYDSIQSLKQYIIGKHKKGIDIYNSKLDKLPTQNVRQAYYDRENLQILTNNEVLYIDALGKETKRQNITYGFCGTVSSTNFSIKESKKAALNTIEIYHGGPGRSNHFKETISLKNLSLIHEVTFLNKSKSDGYTGNSGFIDGYVNRTNLLVVKKDEKVGLFTYNYNDVKFNYNKNQNGIIDLNASKYGSTAAKELLPIMYDKIELKDPLIIITKDNQLGIYPLKKGLKYKIFGKIQVNFMRYETLNGKKGWIDVNTYKEFPDK